MIPAVAIALLLPDSYKWPEKFAAGWGLFALTYLIVGIVIMYRISRDEIKEYAAAEDGSRVLVLSVIMIAVAAIFGIVVLLVLDKDSSQIPTWAFLLLTIGNLLVTFMLVHMIYTFHYARLYFDDSGKKKPLDFPDEDEPDYWDFAYFAFVIGCTFQTSDVDICDRQIRRTVLAHSLLSFLINSFLVALTINIVAGLTDKG